MKPSNPAMTTNDINEESSSDDEEMTSNDQSQWY